MTTQKSPLGVECEFSDEQPRQFYGRVLPGGAVTVFYTVHVF